MTGSNLDGTMNPRELALAIGELLRILQVPRSLPGGVRPDIKDAFDKLHGELAFGWPTAQEYADIIEKRFGFSS